MGSKLMEESVMNGEKFARRATRAWRLRRHWHIGSSCDHLELFALHYARPLSRSGAAAFGRGTADETACGRAGASGATQRGLRTVESDALWWFRRRLGRALYPPTDGGFE